MRSLKISFVFVCFSLNLLGVTKNSFKNPTKNPDRDLYDAVSARNFQMVNAFAAGGGRFSFYDKNGMNCLHLAARFSDEKCLSFLLFYANEDHLFNCDTKGNLVLHHAVKARSLSCIKWLLSHYSYASLETENTSGLTAYQMAKNVGGEFFEFFV